MPRGRDRGRDKRPMFGSQEEGRKVGRRRRKTMLQEERDRGKKIKDEGEIGREIEKHTHFCIHSLDKRTRSGNNGCPEGAGHKWGLQLGETFYLRSFYTHLIY